MPIEEAMRTQRSIRRLKSDPVDDTLVLHLLELALKAPSGGNRQNAEFIVVRDPEVKRGLARLNRVAWSAYGRIWKFFARNDPKTLRTMKAVDWETEHYEEIPVVIVACLRWTAYGPIVSGWRPPFPPFLAGIYYGSIFPAVQNLLLAARAAGLGASLTVMPLWSVALARRVLGLPLWVSPVAAIPMGWPIGHYGTTTRAPVGDAVHFDRYGHRPYRGCAASALRSDETGHALDGPPSARKARR
ncbi:MAG TPA: nitroreductase family protein [Myxococcota bacterium]|nr:nitroreductase family protein [Myxococcota bacterium]